MERCDLLRYVHGEEAQSRVQDRCETPCGLRRPNSGLGLVTS